MCARAQRIAKVCALVPLAFRGVQLEGPDGFPVKIGPDLHVLIACSKLHVCISTVGSTPISASAHWSLPLLAKARRPPIWRRNQTGPSVDVRGAKSKPLFSFRFRSLKSTRRCLALDLWKDGLQAQSAFGSGRPRRSCLIRCRREFEGFRPTSRKKWLRGQRQKKRDACVYSPSCSLRRTTGRVAGSNALQGGRKLHSGSSLSLGSPTPMHALAIRPTQLRRHFETTRLDAKQSVLVVAFP